MESTKDITIVVSFIYQIGRTFETYFFILQATASIALYSMSLLCIILGGIRSARYVKRMISKKKLIEVGFWIFEK